MRRVLMAMLIVAVSVNATSAFTGGCGDVNNTGTVNALDITYLINYLYKHGPAPNCASGDVNNSTTVNALDITYLINFLYKHGPAPNCGPVTGTVTDIDGNVYQTIKICNQWWMVQNLKVSHYSNGEAIPNVTNGGTWAGFTTGAYCNYNNDVNIGATYGGLYNWYAVSDSRNIAPAGWHVPSDAEWQTLVDYLGGDAFAGGKMKEAGTAHWWSPNFGATNESGFTGLPGGDRANDGFYYDIAHYALFWSSTEYDSGLAWFRTLYYSSYSVGHDFWMFSNDKRSGFSVRCVKD